MIARDRATTRDAIEATDRADQYATPNRPGSPGAMALQSSRGYEAAPQAFVRLTGSHLAKPRLRRAAVTD